LCFEDRVIVLNDMLYQYGGSTTGARHLHQGCHDQCCICANAEAAALALAATVNDALNINNTTFLSDCQQLVHFLNDKDQTIPPEWKIKLFANCSAHRRSKIFKVNRNLNSTVDNLVEQASSASVSNSSVFDFEPVCSNL